MTETYYIRRREGDVPQGPFSPAVLSEMFSCGELAADALCLRVGQGDWIPLVDVLNPPACPPSYKVWSYISAVCCFPFSVVAVRQSAHVRSLHAQGKYAEARAASCSALRWNIFFSMLILLLLTSVMVVICMVYDAWGQYGADFSRLLR